MKSVNVCSYPLPCVNSVISSYPLPYANSVNVSSNPLPCVSSVNISTLCKWCGCLVESC